VFQGTVRLGGCCASFFRGKGFAACKRIMEKSCLGGLMPGNGFGNALSRVFCVLTACTPAGIDAETWFWNLRCYWHGSWKL